MKGRPASRDSMSSLTASIAVTTRDFRAIVLESATPVVVDFWAPWCVWCGKLSSTFEELAAKMRSELKFVKVNVDQEPELAQRYGVTGLPTLKFYCEGREIGEIIGAPSKDRIEATFRSIIERHAACGVKPAPAEA